VTNGAEGVSADHVQESLDKFAAWQVLKTVQVSQTYTHLGCSCKNGSQLLHGSDPHDSDLAHPIYGLICVGGLVGGQMFRSEHNDVVVEHVGEEGRNI